MGNPDDFAIVGLQLARARRSLGISTEDAARRAGVPESEVLEWERGVASPTIDQLWSLADLYERTSDYFFRDIPALPEVAAFRSNLIHSVKDLPAPARSALVRFDELCRASAEMESSLGTVSEITTRGKHVSERPEELAEIERTRMELGDRPIRDLRARLTAEGVRIFFLLLPGLPPEELSGLSWWHPHYGPCILVNGKSNPGRRAFTLAHEYAHLLRSEGAVGCAYMLDIPEERYANQFAACFLMPESSMTAAFLNVVGSQAVDPTDRELGRLASKFGVSLEALGWRLETIGLVRRGFTSEQIQRWETRPFRGRAPRGPKWRRQLGEGFVSLAVTAHESGKVSAAKLAKYFGLNIRETMDALNHGQGETKN